MGFQGPTVASRLMTYIYVIILAALCANETVMGPLALYGS